MQKSRAGAFAPARLLMISLVLNLIQTRNTEKSSDDKHLRIFIMAEQEGFEPSVPLWGTHDFQSCPL